MNTHKEAIGNADGVCVDCDRFYECTIREAAENRKAHITECGQFKEAK